MLLISLLLIYSAVQYSKRNKIQNKNSRALVLVWAPPSASLFYPCEQPSAGPPRTALVALCSSAILFFLCKKMEKGKSLRLPTPVSHSLQSPAPPLRWRAWNSILLQVPRKSHANRPRTGRDWSPHMAGIARGRLAEERRSWRKARHRGDCMFLCLILLGLRNECMRPNSGPPLWLCCQVC